MLYWHLLPVSCQEKVPERARQTSISTENQNMRRDFVPVCPDQSIGRDGDVGGGDALGHPGRLGLCPQRQPLGTEYRQSNSHSRVIQPFVM